MATFHPVPVGDPDEEYKQMKPPTLEQVMAGIKKQEALAREAEGPTFCLGDWDNKPTGTHHDSGMERRRYYRALGMGKAEGCLGYKEAGSCL